MANNVARNVSKANLDGAGQVTTPPPWVYIYMSLEVLKGFWVCKVVVVVGGA